MAQQVFSGNDTSLEGCSSEQKFTIRHICPNWGYTTETTKVQIAGYFLCDPSKSAWSCMFGDTEVPVEILHNGVGALLCRAPPHDRPGKVNLCITSSNRKCCSEIKKFEYCAPSNFLVLIRGFEMDKATDEVLERLKNQLHRWLSSQLSAQPVCSLPKEEHEILHLIAGWGFEWALNPILSLGVDVNFRDTNGWTALHWAARFGREKMVEALLVAGASAGAVTDPT